MTATDALNVNVARIRTQHARVATLTVRYVTQLDSLLNARISWKKTVRVRPNREAPKRGFRRAIALAIVFWCAACSSRKSATETLRISPR